MVKMLQNIQSGPLSSQIVEAIRYLTAILPTRPPILSQQIMANFQLSQEALNKIISQINEMAETT